MTNEQYINYILESENIIKENKNTKITNYLLISFLLITSTVLLLKVAEEYNNKKTIKELNKSNNNQN